MLKKFIIAGCIIFSCLTLGTFGKEISIRTEDGSLTLADFLDACVEAAHSIPSKRVSTDLPGNVIYIKGVPYEIRFFSFEDTSGKLPSDITFRDYANQNSLLALKSISTKPLPGIQFESFDFRKNPKNDGVYFSMAIRKIEKGDN